MFGNRRKNKVKKELLSTHVMLEDKTFGRKEKKLKEPKKIVQSEYSKKIEAKYEMFIQKQNERKETESYDQKKPSTPALILKRRTPVVKTAQERSRERSNGESKNRNEKTKSEEK